MPCWPAEVLAIPSRRCAQMTIPSWKSTFVVAGAVALVSCGEQPTISPITSPLASSKAAADEGALVDATTARLVRDMAAGRGIGALPAAPRVRPALSRLGQALLFDPILSGKEPKSFFVPGGRGELGKADEIGEDHRAGG